jgi:hypothetical protein
MGFEQCERTADVGRGHRGAAERAGGGVGGIDRGQDLVARRGEVDGARAVIRKLASASVRVVAATVTMLSNR